MPGLGRHLTIGDLLGQQIGRSPLVFAVVGDVAVEQDPVQPATEVGAVAVGVKPDERLRRGVLNQVFGICVIARQFERLPV